MKIALAALLALTLAPATPAQEWNRASVPTTASFRGLSVAPGGAVWASGTNGRVARSADGGVTWSVTTVPGAESLDLRDIEAFDARHAVAMSAGPGDASRLFTSDDGGRSWRQRHANAGPDGFYDAIAFWDRRNGILMGDPVGGRFAILTTRDGGASWQPIAPEGMPPALPNEGAFAASGTCLAVAGSGSVWFATGGAGVARVFRSSDRGRTWAVSETPISAAKAYSGVFSIAFADAKNGVAVGGDFQNPADAASNVAVTADGGVTWRAVEGPRPRGYRSAAAFAPGCGGPVVIATGPTGSDLSRDGGRTWEPAGDAGFNAVAVGRRGLGWAAGAGGALSSVSIAPCR